MQWHSHSPSFSCQQGLLCVDRVLHWLGHHTAEQNVQQHNSENNEPYAHANTMQPRELLEDECTATDSEAD